MTMIDALLDGARTGITRDSAGARTRAAGASVVEAAPEVDVARPARAACGDGAGQRRRARVDGYDPRAAGVRAAGGGDGRRARARAHRERGQGSDGTSVASTTPRWARPGGS